LNPPDNSGKHKILGELAELGDTELVFSEPWEAQAFAMAVTLSSNGYFTWKEWAANGGTNDGSDYYQNWVAALERLIIDKDITDFSNLKSIKVAWEDAYKATPHGKPVHLSK
jgi:nitrile hydratase accessory protein